MRWALCSSVNPCPVSNKRLPPDHSISALKPCSPSVPETGPTEFSQQARADLYIFGVKLYAEAIAATLSMDNVLPRGTYVEFDAEDYLAENYVADQSNQPQENTQQQIANR